MIDTTAFAKETTASVFRASIAVLEYYRSGDFEVTDKGSEGPLTTADLKSNQILKSALSNILPEAGWLSEETPDDDHRLTKDSVWIVDPIDGTRDFVKKTDQFSISVGLSHKGVPVLGCVAVPAEGYIATGYNGKVEKWSFNPKIDISVTNTSFERSCKCEVLDKEILQSNFKDLADSRILISSSEKRKGVFDNHPTEWKLIDEGSVARKLAMVGTGQAAMNISLYPKNEWDICGGCGILYNAGLIYRTLEPLGNLSFNNRNPTSYGLVAGQPRLVDQYIDFFLQKKIEVKRSYEA